MKKNFYLIAITILFIGGCQKEKINKQGMVNDHFWLENNKATMQVYVEGNMDNDKILIMVHGGPGDGSLYFNMGEVNTIAETQFAVAYWDQRLAGSSQGNSLDKDLEDYVSDLKKLIVLLHHRYGNDKKIYLLAHSWGGIIAPKFLEEGDNQSLISGWIQVDGVHNYPLNDALSREMIISSGSKEIAAGRNTDKWKEMVDYCTNNDPTNNRSVARKINAYANSANALLSEVYPENPSRKERITYFIKNYNYPITTYLVNGVYNNFVGKVEDMVYDENISSNLHIVRTPVLLLGGKYDFVCPSGSMDDIMTRVSSTDKSTKIFSNSAHSPMFTEPVDFWNTVSDWVKLH